MPQQLGEQVLEVQDPETVHAEEERRLAHVAATRAKERHFISCFRVGWFRGQAWLYRRSGILDGVLHALGHAGEGGEAAPGAARQPDPALEFRREQWPPGEEEELLELKARANMARAAEEEQQRRDLLGLA